jgi:hypothetical protein
MEMVPLRRCSKGSGKGTKAYYGQGEPLQLVNEMEAGNCHDIGCEIKS